MSILVFFGSLLVNEIDVGMPFVSLQNDLKRKEHHILLCVKINKNCNTEDSSLNDKFCSGGNFHCANLELVS